MKARKLADMVVEGEAVAFYAPPHDEPDFPWVAALQLASAFIPADAALHMLQNTQRYEEGKTVLTVADGDVLVTIMPHPLAQGLCGAIDDVLSDAPSDEGLAYKAYCKAMAVVMRDHYRLPIHEALAAFKNAGGPFLRD